MYTRPGIMYSLRNGTRGRVLKNENVGRVYAYPVYVYEPGSTLSHIRNICSIELVFNSCTPPCTYFHSPCVCALRTEHLPMFMLLNFILLHFMSIKYSWHFRHTFIMKWLEIGVNKITVAANKSAQCTQSTT